MYLSSSKRYNQGNGRFSVKATFLSQTFILCSSTATFFCSFSFCQFDICVRGASYVFHDRFDIRLRPAY
jgi:hypothetical protein